MKRSPILNPGTDHLLNLTAAGIRFSNRDPGPSGQSPHADYWVNMHSGALFHRDHGSWTRTSPNSVLAESIIVEARTREPDLTEVFQ